MVITKCEFRYMKFAKSTSHGVWWISACWKPGSKKAPSEFSRSITWRALANAAKLPESVIPRTTW